MTEQDENPVVGVLEDEGQKILSGLKDIVLDPAAVDRLYNANPLVLSKAQRRVVIETVRRQRAEREVRKERKAKKVKATSDEIASLTLDDLGALE